jgi:hypothetical protein
MQLSNYIHLMLQIQDGSKFMKYLKAFEKTDKFISERDKKVHYHLIDIGDWIEYYSEEYDEKINKFIRIKYKGYIKKKENPYKIYNILVYSDDEGIDEWIRLRDIIRKIPDYEIDANKYNL